MRPTLLAALIVLAALNSASGQTAAGKPGAGKPGAGKPGAGQTGARFEVGPVLRLDKVFIEGDASGTTTVAGAGATVRLSRTYAVEAEITQASGRIERSYEGWFVSYATNPNASREEIERLAPTASRSLGYEPGIGGSAAFVARGAIGRRVARRRIASRRATTSRRRLTILTIPTAWIRPCRVTSRTPRRTCAADSGPTAWR